MPRKKTKRPVAKKGRLTVRQATLSDLTTLVEQRRAMWAELGTWSDKEMARTDTEYAKWARAHMRNESYVGWLVEEQSGRIVGGGCLWLKPIQPRPGLEVQLQPYLLSMYTEPKYRGMGVATMIVEEALEWSRKRRYSNLVLHASEMGRRVYSRLGFKRTWEMSADLPVKSGRLCAVRSAQ